jgi:uncharacterized protein (DUF1330 family)
MKTNYKIFIALLAGAAVGALAMQGLHAQAKPPVYSIEEVDVTNPDGYKNEFGPAIQAANKAAGVHALAAGGKITVIDGAPPKSRVVLQVWDSLESFQSFRNSAAYKDARKIGDKYATYRSFVIEGLPQ